MKIDFSTCRGIFDLAQKEQKVEELEAKMQGDEFWEDNDAAQKVISECNALKLWTIPYNDLKQSFTSVQALLPEVIAEKEDELLDELKKELIRIDKSLSEMEIRRCYQGSLIAKIAI